MEYPSYGEIRDELESESPQAGYLPALQGKSRRLGQGCYRTAYAFSPTAVLKVGDCRSNEAEVRIWTEREDLRPWLCPVLQWAEDYTWVIMARAEEVGKHYESELPDAITVCINDLHSDNIGVVAGSVVVIDYGLYLG